MNLRRPATGLYCLEAAAGIDPASGPALVGVEWGFSTGADLLAFNVSLHTAQCNANEFAVRTYRFGANPAAPTLSNEVAFEIFVP